MMIRPPPPQRKTHPRNQIWPEIFLNCSTDGQNSNDAGHHQTTNNGGRNSGRDRSLHYTPTRASYSQRGAELPAPLHQEGTQPPGVNGLHYGFLLSLELERVLPICLNEKEEENKLRSGLHGVGDGRNGAIAHRNFLGPNPSQTTPINKGPRGARRQ